MDGGGLAGYAWPEITRYRSPGEPASSGGESQRSAPGAQVATAPGNAHSWGRCIRLYSFGGFKRQAANAAIFSGGKGAAVDQTRAKNRPKRMRRVPRLNE
jgi:hypothetical protein